MASPDQEQKDEVNDQPITLGEMIGLLETRPADQTVRFDFAGFRPGHLDSYRGYYDHLAWTPARDGAITVAELRTQLRDAVGRVFTGYKGGAYRMDGRTRGDEPVPAHTWRPMTDDERTMAIALGRCRMPPATQAKACARKLALFAVPEVRRPVITDAQARALRSLVVRFRRQIDPTIVALAQPPASTHDGERDHQPHRFSEALP